VDTVKVALATHVSQQLTIAVINNSPPPDHHRIANTFGSGSEDINDNQIDHEDAST
jgi:hypothetical protein